MNGRIITISEPKKACLSLLLRMFYPSLIPMKLSMAIQNQIENKQHKKKDSVSAVPKQFFKVKAYVFR